MTTISTFAQAIPVRFRQVTYSALALAVMLEVIWDVVPDVLEGKLLATLSALGFGLALGNTAKG